MPQASPRRTSDSPGADSSRALLQSSATPADPPQGIVVLKGAEVCVAGVVAVVERLDVNMGSGRAAPIVAPGGGGEAVDVADDGAVIALQMIGVGTIGERAVGGVCASIDLPTGAILRATLRRC